MTTKPQSTTTKLEGSEPTLEPQDMTDEELSAALDFHRAAIQRLSNEGAKIWRLRIRLNDGTPEDKQMLAELHERRNARVPANGVPTVDHEAIAKRLDYAAWVGFNQSDSEFEKGYKHAMGVAAQVVRDAAASTVQAGVPAEGENRLCLLCGHYAVAPDGTCMAPVPICSDDYHGTRRCGCRCSFKTAPAPSAAIQDETENAARRVAPLRTALDEIETALISIADGVSPQEAVGKAFNIINHERSKLNAAASERCLSEGES